MIRLCCLLLLALLSLSSPAHANGGGGEGGGGFQKLDNLIVEMWDKEGNFHMLVAKTQAYFPAKPNLAKGIGIKIKHRIQAVPYEEFRKPGGTQLLKDLIKEIIAAEPGSENVEEILIMSLSYQ